MITIYRNERQGWKLPVIFYRIFFFFQSLATSESFVFNIWHLWIREMWRVVCNKRLDPYLSVELLCYGPMSLVFEHKIITWSIPIDSCRTVNIYIYTRMYFLVRRYFSGAYHLFGYCKLLWGRPLNSSPKTLIWTHEIFFYWLRLPERLQ